MKYSLRFILAIIAIPVILAGCSGEKPLNVLLVTLDTTRADHLGCYGYDKAETPTLDKLAEGGLLYEKAYCQVPLTLPSHASILTGLQPPEHGIRLNGAYRLSDNIPTIAEILKGKGYDTAAFVSAFVLNSQFGLDRGFDVYNDDIVDSPELYIPERPADKVAAEAVHWLNDRTDKKPFFLWVHFFDPHMPYTPPSPYAEKFADSPYDGEIAFADKQFASVLKALEQDGVSDSTVIIIVGDHGESLGEHGEATHALFVYDSTIHVPLIVKLPATVAAKYPDIAPGERISRHVETIDIAPTVLELANTKKDGKMTGQSLLSQSTSESRMCYAESLYSLSLGWSPLQSGRSDDWKYIQAPKEELYKTSDTSEKTNVAEANGSVIREMKKQLRKYPVMSESTELEKEGLAPDVAKNLRDLGYVSTGVVKRTPEQLLQLPDPKNKIDVFDNINSARRLSNLNQYRESVEMLLPILETEADNPEVNHILGAAYTRLGEYEKGLEFLTRYNKLAQGDLQAMFYLGVAYIRSGSPEPALKPLEECVEMMPSYAEAWDQIGVAYGMLGDFTKALKAGEKAVENDPSNPDYQKNLGVSYLRINDVPRAEAVFKKAVEMRPNDAVFRVHYGLALNRSGRFDQAAEQFEEALNLDPENIEAKERLIEAYFRLEKKDKALELAEELAKEGKLGAVGSFYYGVILLEKERYGECVPLLKAAIIGMPGYAPAVEILSVSTIEQADQATAAWLLEQAEKGTLTLREEVASQLEDLQ